MYTIDHRKACNDPTVESESRPCPIFIIEEPLLSYTHTLTTYDIFLDPDPVVKPYPYTSNLPANWPEPLPLPLVSAEATLLGFRRTGMAPEEVRIHPAMGFLNMLALAQKHTHRR